MKLQKNLTRIHKGFDPKVYANLDGNLCGSTVAQHGEIIFEGTFIHEKDISIVLKLKKNLVKL